jgi:hypothetical protein
LKLGGLLRRQRQTPMLVAAYLLKESTARFDSYVRLMYKERRMVQSRRPEGKESQSRGRETRAAATCGAIGVSGIASCPSSYRYCIFNEPGMVPRPRHCTPIAFSMTRSSRRGLSARVGADRLVGAGRPSNCPDLSPKGSRTERTERQKRFQPSDHKAKIGNLSDLSDLSDLSVHGGIRAATRPDDPITGHAHAGPVGPRDHVPCASMSGGGIRSRRRKDAMSLDGHPCCTAVSAVLAKPRFWRGSRRPQKIQVPLEFQGLAPRLATAPSLGI